MQISGSVSLGHKLDQCELGVEKQIVLTVVPTRNDKSGFSADVTGLDHYDEDDATGDEEAHPPKSKDKSGARIIDIGLGKSKKSKAY